jgi:hypothetical protein
MKKIKIGFAAIVALFAMSFTIASNSKAFHGKTNMVNCYETITTANYMTNCAATPSFAALTCSNKPSAIGSALQNNLNLTGLISVSTCDGGDFLCCINLKASTTNPCSINNPTSLQKGGFKDFNGNAVPSTNWILINDIQCKSE